MTTHARNRLRLIKGELASDSAGVQKARPARFRLPPAALAFVIAYLALLALHAPLLKLPYFWDEAGYYVPAAHDLYSTGDVIPYSTAANPHPPLVAAALALGWRIAGFSPVTTRLIMLMWAALALTALYRLSRRVANHQVAIAAVALTALYPVFFAQSVMAHLDLAAAALTLFALDAYVARKPRAFIVLFALAALAKETAIIAPLALFVWELVCLDLRRWPRLEPACPPAPRQMWQPLLLLAPCLPLAAWFAFQYVRTGHLLGDPGFVRYNLTATLSPVRFLAALAQRLWHLTGHMGIYVLSAATLLAMLFPALPESGRGVLVMPEPAPDSGEPAVAPGLDSSRLGRKRIAIARQAAFAVVTLAYLLALSVLGGALLPRYLLPVVPLFILICVSTLRRRIAMWPYAVAIVALAFVIALFVNPPYRFAPEDNLAWRDYVLLHQHAAQYVTARHREATLLTAWPASDELTRPYLGYVPRAQRVLRIENFTAAQIAAAAQRKDFDIALLFSTKYEPPGGSPLDHVAWWQDLQQRFFDYHRDLSPEAAAAALGVRIVFLEARRGQWVAIAER